MTVELVVQTVGIEYRNDAGVIDEFSGACTSIDEVMGRRSAVAAPVHRLKQRLNVEG